MLTWPPWRRRFEAWKPRLFVGSESALPGGYVSQLELGCPGPKPRSPRGWAGLSGLLANGACFQCSMILHTVPGCWLGLE